MKVKSYEEMNREVNDIWSIKDPNERHDALVARAVRSARTINQGFKRMADKGFNYNDAKDTVAFCGNTGEVCNYLGIVPKSLWRHYNRKDRKHPKYLIFKYLTSDLGKEDDL